MVRTKDKWLTKGGTPLLMLQAQTLPWQSVERCCAHTHAKKHIVYSHTLTHTHTQLQVGFASKRQQYCQKFIRSARFSFICFCAEYDDDDHDHDNDDGGTYCLPLTRTNARTRVLGRQTSAWLPSCKVAAHLAASSNASRASSDARAFRSPGPEHEHRHYLARSQIS